MTRWRFYRLYGHMLWGVAVLVFFVAVTAWLILGCGGSLPPAREAIQTTRIVVRAMCADSMQVGECLDMLEQGAAILDGDDGGVR